LATKDLSRTVIEGGRDYHNCWERRRSHRKLRTRERSYLGAVALDSRVAEERAEPLLTPVRKTFHDKLGPAYRWLRSCVGRRWDDVRSELIARFDTRTTAGAHIVYGHLLPEVEGHQRWRPEFFVDGGVLRYRKRVRWSGRPTFVYVKQAQGWLAGRTIGRHGARRYWLEPTVAWRRVNGVPKLEPTGRFRQGHALSEGDVAAWLAFPAEARRELELVLSASP
jgi:hypothetical protein